MLTQIKEVSLGILAQKIAQRQKFIKKVIRYAEKVIFTPKLGTILSSHEFSCYTQTAAELNDFHGFSFFSYGTYTMFGGETVKVWYHPGQHERPTVPVFEVEWWDIKKCEVKYFDPNPEWQDAIRRLMGQGQRTIDRAVRQRKREQLHQEQEHREQRAHELQRVSLQGDTNRLKLS